MSFTERINDLSAAEVIGDLCAPEGSRHWCVGMRVEIQRLLDDHRRDHEALQRCVESFVSLKGWTALIDAKGKPFASYADFCRARKPHGLGRDPAEIDQLLKEGAAKKSPQARAENPPVLLDGPGPATEEEKANGVLNTNRPDRGSTNADYLTARIARDHPDVLARMKAGEFPSVRAAAKVAGIVRDPTPLELMKRAWTRASKAEKDAFMDWANEQGW